MKIELFESTVLRAPVERVWAILADIEQLKTFSGWGPIPGISEASWIKGDGGVGSIRLVKNRDGTQHREEVMALEPGVRIEDRIFALESPLRVMVRDVRDHFALHRQGDDTRLERRFVFELSSPVWWPAAMLIRIAMRRAVVAHHAKLAALL